MRRSILVRMIVCLRACAVLEQKSHCAKWPVTEVFHVNPMIHTEPPRHRAHTCSNEVGFLLTPYPGLWKRVHTHLRASAGWGNIVIRLCSAQAFPSMHIQFSFHPRRSRKKSCDVLTEMITILFFTSGVLFYWYRKWRLTPNKQTAKVGRKTSARQQTSEWETRHVTG